MRGPSLCSFFNDYSLSYYLKRQRKNTEDSTHVCTIYANKLLTLLLILLQVFLALKGVGSSSPALEQLKFSLGMDSRGDAVLSHLLGITGVS